MHKNSKMFVKLLSHVYNGPNHEAWTDKKKYYLFISITILSINNFIDKSVGPRKVRVGITMAVNLQLRVYMNRQTITWVLEVKLSQNAGYNRREWYLENYIIFFQRVCAYVGRNHDGCAYAVCSAPEFPDWWSRLGGYNASYPDLCTSGKLLLL